MSAAVVLWAALGALVLTGANLVRAEIVDRATRAQTKRVLAWIDAQAAENADLMRMVHEAIGLATIGAVDEANALIRDWNAKQRAKADAGATEGCA